MTGRALRQIGPLLIPRKVADRLGVSVTAVNNWRHRDKLLGVRFDDHQNLYVASARSGRWIAVPPASPR